MVAETTVRRIGNSQGITIPKGMCDEVGISLGSRVLISSDADGIRVSPATGRTLRDRLPEWDGVRYGSSELDWGAPVGQEMW